MVATAHDQFKDPALYRGVGLVVDTRNIVKPAPGGPSRVVVEGVTARVAPNGRVRIGAGVTRASGPRHLMVA